MLKIVRKFGKNKKFFAKMGGNYPKLAWKGLFFVKWHTWEGCGRKILKNLEKMFDIRALIVYNDKAVEMGWNGKLPIFCG